MQRLFTQKHPLVVLGLGGLLWLGSMASATASLESGMQAYETGDGVAAAALLKPQAEQGVSEAQLALGYLYYVGQGLQQNHAMAARWFSAAAEQGEPAAMYNLAWLYETGEGVQVNAAKRASWLRKSAEAGYPLAQYELAQSLEFSSSPAQQEAAAAWYKKAAAAGLPAAKKNSPTQTPVASSALVATGDSVLAPLSIANPVAAAKPTPTVVTAKAEVQPKQPVVVKHQPSPNPNPKPPVINSAKTAPEQAPPLVVAKAPSLQEAQTQAIDRSVPVGKPLPPLPKPKPEAVVKLPPPTPKAELNKPASKPKPEPEPESSVKAAVAPKPSVALPTGERALISVSIANMRAAPSTQAATTSRLVRGVEIVIHETFAGWTRVTVVSQPQLNGWVNTGVYRPIQ